MLKYRVICIHKNWEFCSKHLVCTSFIGTLWSDLKILFTKKIEENVNGGFYVKSRKYSVCTAFLVGAKSQKHFRAENQFTFCISAENPSFLHSYACKKSIKLCILIKKVLFLLGLLIGYINCNSYNEGWRLDALLNSP